MLKKILATALAAAMIFGMAVTAFAASPFPDTAGVSNEAVIARLKALGIVKGDDLGNFNPTNPINRAEFTAMVVRMMGLETAAGYVATPTAFPDVTSAYAWAYGYINIATGRGLIKGYEDGTFRPGNNVTEAEALTILLRSLGYTDNLPGNWPIDYVMKGAELEVIASGFSASTAATRSLIATLVNNTLDENLVKEDVTAAGTFVGFVDKFAAPTTMYQDSYDVAAAAPVYLTGICNAVDTTNGTITVGVTTADYVSGVAIYGKDTLKELVGQYVKATYNDDGDIMFVTVTTKQEVVGDITAVDTVNLKVTVGGTQYTVLSDATVIKNGATLTTTIAGALVAVKDSSATLLLNSAGKVYRIVASLLDKSSDITGKVTETSPTGTVTNKITTTLGGVTKYAITSSTTVVRNGATATFADLVIGDEVKYSVNGTDLVYLDAFINVLKGYTVTNYIADASGASIVATKDGVETTFAVAKKTDGTLEVTLANLTVGLGKSYSLTLNRDGKVKAVAATAAAGAVTSQVKTLASKDQVKNSAGVYEYRFNFTDGTSVNVSTVSYVAGPPAAYNFAAATRNGVALVGVTPADVWNAAAANDMYFLTGAAAPYAVQLFAPSVSGRVVHAAPPAAGYQLVSSTGTVLAQFNSVFGTATTLNGVAVSYDSLPAEPAGIATYTAKVTFGSASSTVVPGPVSLAAEEFVAGSVALPVKSIASDATQYTFTLDLGTGATLDVVANVKTDDAVTDTIIMKAGAKVTAADVKIGDKLLVATPVGGVAPYIKAAADTTAPVVTCVAGNVTWTPAAGAVPSSLVITFTTDEPCRKGYAWVGGVQYEAAFAAGTWTATVTGLAAKPTTVTVAATDYSGNVSNAVDVTGF